MRCDVVTSKQKKKKSKMVEIFDLLIFLDERYPIKKKVLTEQIEVK